MADQTPSTSATESPASDSLSISEQQQSSQDLELHRQLTQALHSLDLLNAQLGVAGALLVNLYHLQRQREAATQAPPPPQAYPPYPYPTPPAGYQSPPPPPPGYPQVAPPPGYYQPPSPPYQPPPPAGPPPTYYQPQPPIDSINKGS